jgi:hypothetical protein
MAYDEKLAERVRADLDVRGLRFEERKMFGGLTYMISGHMCAGIVGDELMVRTGPVAHAAALKRPHARPMDFTGRPMKGFLFVAPAGVRTAGGLRKWLDLGVEHAQSLPPKKAAKQPRAPSPRRQRPA